MHLFDLGVVVTVPYPPSCECDPLTPIKKFGRDDKGMFHVAWGRKEQQPQQEEEKETGGVGHVACKRGWSWREFDQHRHAGQQQSILVQLPVRGVANNWKQAPTPTTLQSVA